MSITEKAHRSVEFNQWWHEYQAKRLPRILTIDDAEYQLPPGLPAEVMVTVLKYQAEKGDEAEFDLPVIWKMLTLLFGGDDQLEEIVSKHKLDIVALQMLFERVMASYNVSEPEPEGNAGQAAIELTSLPTGT